MRRPDCLLPALLLLAGLRPLAAQEPDPAQRLPELEVTVTREPTSPGTAGLAVSVVDSAGIHRGRSLASLGDALVHVPGVLVRDRGDPTQDVRLTIRGAGARANFGVRGVRVLVDGVPATLPDGQTPLTAADLQLVERIEVARGPLAALHGNGSLGVVAIETAARLEGPWQVRGGIQAGSDATTTWHAVAGGGTPRHGGLVAATRTATDGWRQHAAAEQLRMRAALEWRPGAATITLRASHADDPRLESPGALTLPEAATDPLQANPNAVLRNAGKQVRQSSVSATWRQPTGSVGQLQVTAWGIGRDLDNPIAAPAPQPADPEEGVWIGIVRRVVGVRAAWNTALGERTALVTGLDAQRMVDDRVNRRHRAGVPYGTAFLDQEERIVELGPFAQVSHALQPDLVVRVAARHDRVGFTVDDALDPAAGGSRTMAAWSGSGAIAWQPGAVQTWFGFGTAFETPTTTELANRPDGTTGLNAVLDPSRTVSVEVGIRARGRATRVELVGWHAATTDAITAIAEVGGRSFFANVGATRTRGLELALVRRLAPTVDARLSATWSDARFGDDAVAGDGTSIAGHRLPGVVPFTASVGVTARQGPVVLDLVHELASGAWADDRNTLRVKGWGAGITDLHVRWGFGSRAALTAAVRNAFNVDHVSGIVVNGGFGRIAEPGRPRSVTIGGEISIGG